MKEIFWPKRERVTRDWRRWLKQMFQDLYSSSHIIRVIKLRKIKGQGM
jgi:hypothetical protein